MLIPRPDERIGGIYAELWILFYQETSFNLDGCDCDGVLHVVSVLAAIAAIFCLSSILFLFSTFHFYKKSRSPIMLPQQTSLEDFSTKQPHHKINSFTCLELKEIVRKSLKLKI